MTSELGHLDGHSGTGRRGFLLLAALALGTGSGVLAGCSRAVTGGSHPGSSTTPPGSAPPPSASPVIHTPPDAADWDGLAQLLSTGRVVTPGSSTYRSAKQLFDPRFDINTPAGIAYCASPADVSACLSFVAKFGLQVAARSGGHSYCGWSSPDGGLVLDVSQMNHVDVDAAAGTVRVGAGTLLIDLYSALAAHGLAVPGGSCPTVGIAGLALGGGVGVVGRLYGLTCDNTVSVQIVTADGKVRECNANSDPDLFWACRGGGGGNFGVVTAFTFRTQPARDLVLFYLTWPWSQAAAVISAWQSWAPSAPDELWSNLHLSASPGGSEPSVSVGGTYAGSAGQAQALLSRLYSAAGSAPSGPFVATESYLNVMLVEAGCASLSVAQCHQPSQNLAGVLPREPEYAKSDFYTTPIPAAGIDVMLGQVEHMQQVPGAAGASGGVAFDAFGGAINRVSPDATAFVHRDTLFLAQYTTGWSDSSPGAGTRTAPVQAQLAWLKSFHAAMRPYASGQAYQNYLDPDLADWQRAYYGANYPRLQRVKAAVDPGNVFHFPQSIELPG
jgi:FAD/FMN-containing dehydrogenase